MSGPEDELDGWLRWRFASAHTLREHGHETVTAWWLDAAGTLRCAEVTVSEVSTGRALHVAAGYVPEVVSLHYLLEDLREDLELWDRGRARWHADLARTGSAMDRLVAAADRAAEAAV